MFCIKFASKEVYKFENLKDIRELTPDTHGRNLPSYATQFSLYVNIWLFLMNFGCFMVYFELTMIAGILSMVFQIPLILQFVLLFFYLNRILLYQIKILSLDKFEENEKQQEWQSSVQVRIYIFAFLIVIFMFNIYLNEFFIFFLGCSFWIM